MLLALNLASASLVIASLLSVPASTGTCGPEVQAALGRCPDVSQSASSLVVSGTQQRPGTPAAPNAPATPGTRTATSPATPAPPSERALRLAECMDDSGTVRCHTLTDPSDTDSLPAETPAPATPTITLTDVARFAPAPLAATAEPENVGIARLPTNFTTAATTHIQTGTLFGIPLTVRFTPSAYTYDYGDRTTATLTTPGRTWSALGQPQLTPTPTSHTYEERGEYPVTLTTEYAVDVDLGAGWIPVPGHITTTASPQTIRILEAHTALVARTCVEDPHGTGC